MISPSDQSAKLAFDTKGLGDLRAAAKSNSPEALKGAATQFEALFINMMMKSMRDATPQDGALDSEQTKTFTSMLDQQMSQKLAKRGIGLADVLVRQLSAQAASAAQALAIGAEGAPAPATGAVPSVIGAIGAKPAAAPPDAPALGKAGAQPAHIRAFQDELGAHAEAASRATGIPAKFMLGQAALETGWGKHLLRNADGSTSHNLFGIKAGPGWSGKVATAVTTEYVNGKPQTRVEKFRSYDSYADSFKDYGKLIANNPRYSKVMASAQDATGFAVGLQKAGYATDPNYAAKLGRIIKQHLLG